MSRRPAGRSVRPRLRANLRLAWRQLLRAPGSSALVMLLIVLPVAGMTGGAVFWQSHIPTRAQEADLELGRAEAWLQAAGAPDPERWQSVDQPWENGVGEGVTAGGGMIGAAPIDPAGVLPDGVDVRTVREWATVHLDTPDGSARVTATTGGVWDPLFEGRYLVLDGERPTAAGEAMATPGLLERAGAAVGDTIVLSDSGARLTITGTLRRADARPEDPELFLPAMTAGVGGGQPRWFVADWQPDLAGLGELNRAGFIAYARNLVVDPPADARRTMNRADTAQETAMLATGAGIAVFSGYLVVLLAGAAFAVSARRQQRALAVAGSVGAGRSDIFRIVLLQGTLLGSVAAVAGTALGAALAAIGLALTDTGVVNSFRGNWGYRVPWPLLAAVALFAVAVGTIAATAPARAATRGDVLSALRGARRPAAPRRRASAWGAVIAGIGLVATAAGGIGVALLAAVPADDGTVVPQLAAATALILGPVVFQIGFLLAGRWVLAGCARVLARGGLGARIAARDAAAHPARVVPAFAAIAGCAFLASYALGVTGLTTAQNARLYWWSGPPNAVTVWLGQNGPAPGDEVSVAAEELVAPTSPLATALVRAPASTGYDEVTGAATDPAVPVYAVAEQPSAACPLCGGPTGLLNAQLWIVDADEVSTLLGTAVDPSVLAAYREDGRAIATDDRVLSADGEVVVTRWTPEGTGAYYDALNRLDWQDPQAAAGLPRPLGEHGLPALRVDAGRTMQAQALISPQTAAALDIRTVPSQLVAVYDEPLGDAALDQLTEAAAAVPLPADASLGVSREDGPASGDPWLWLISAVTTVLVVGAAAVCLGLARVERRPDDATLTAVGGSRRLRRSINAWQAVLVVGIGSVVGTAAGLVPVWGGTQTSPGAPAGDLPWLWLTLLAFALPAAIGLASWLVPPRRPDLTRRRVIA